MKRSIVVTLQFLTLTSCGDDAGQGGGASATVGSTSTTGSNLPPRTDECRIYTTAQDCGFAPPGGYCKWRTRRIADGCAGPDAVEDVGCYSELSRCDPVPDFIGPNPPTTECGMGQTCTHFESVGVDCVGGVNEGTLSCAAPCEPTTYALCLPTAPP